MVEGPEGARCSASTAANDQSIPVDDVEQMQAALKGAGGKPRREFVVYPDAQHAFNADYRPSYTKDAAEDGWKRLQEWFKKNGAA